MVVVASSIAVERAIWAGLQINRGTPKCLPPMKPDRRRLRVRDERPRNDGVADKCNDPPPHGFAPAEDSIGYKNNITFGLRMVRLFTHTRGAAMSALGH